jgi:hypothetical protein
VAKRAGKVPDHLRSRIFLAVRPQDWLAKARQLKKAADLLLIKFEEEQVRFNEEFERDPSTNVPFPDDSVVTMLLGFAVENLLKGLYVSTLERVEDIKDLSELKFPGQRHELEPIALAMKGALKIKFSQQEVALLHALEHVVLWYGRYPSARNIDDLIPTHEAGFFKKFSFNYPEDHFATLELYQCLEAELANRAKAHSPFPK